MEQDQKLPAGTTQVPGAAGVASALVTAAADGPGHRTKSVILVLSEH